MDMGKTLRIVLIVFGVIVLVAFIAIALFTRSLAVDIVTHLPEERPKIVKNPGDDGRAYEDVTVTTDDGLKLYGWYLPGENGAAVMVLHGSPGGRQDGLYEAALLNEAGFNVLMGSFRAHDECDGILISFGYHEQKDVEAWHEYLQTRPDVDASRIGIFGESMGGGTGILYTANHPDIAAIATGSGFALTRKVVELFIAFENPDLPKWAVPPVASLIVFWAERTADFRTADLDTESVIGDISPRPILIIHGGADDKIGPESGRQLYAAAGEPKELLFIDAAGHVNFEEFQPQRYSQALIDFFDANLLEG
jgi:dipeptidyl aminopeptidase/acylaminoacyl peptidase